MTWTADKPPLALIRRVDTAKDVRRAANIRLEPAFLSESQWQQSLELKDLAARGKSFFAHAIARHPGNLRLHVRRIILHVKTRDPAILGPLCDLFLVLGDNGQALRSRMLALARPLLGKLDYQSLRRQLDTGANDPVALHSLSASAVLSSGITGVTRLIFKQSQADEAPEDPLECAREQLAYGQTELAQETLENAVLANPECLALHLALLEIYRHARQRGPVERQWQALQGRKNPARREWQRLLRQLDLEARTP
jgi:hypothetical protein